MTMTSVPAVPPPTSTPALHPNPVNSPDPDVSISNQGPFARLNAFLDKHVLPYPVRYLTNRITILGTLCLLVPLIAFANITVFVLAANSYLNVMSVVVSSTVLLYSTLSDARDKAAAARREQIAALHQAQVDAMMQADHDRIQEMHDHLDQIQALLSAQLIEIQNENQARYEQRHTEITNQIAAHAKDMADLRAMIQTTPATTDKATPTP